MKIELDEKDVYCMTRVLQGMIYEGSLLYGCEFCKYSSDCRTAMKSDRSIYFSELRKHLSEATGLYLGLMQYSPDATDEVKERLWRHNQFP